MKNAASFLAPLTLALALTQANPALATAYTLGDQDFADGTLLNGVVGFEAAQAGEPAPLNLFIGSDLIDTPVGSRFLDFAVSPGHYAAATLTLGLWDIDSLSPGSQVLVFSVDGVDLTASFDALLEATASPHSRVDVISLALDGAALSALDDGAVSVRIRVGGTGLKGTPGTSNDFSVGNGYGIDFARLDARLAPVSVPTPSTLPLLLAAACGAALTRRRRG